MVKEKWFRWGIGVMMLFLIIFLGTKISFIFTPLVIIVQTLLPPIIVSGVLYYLLRPLVNRLEKKMPRTLAIILVFLGIAGLMTAIVFIVGPELQRQYNHFVENLPSYITSVQQWVLSIMEKDWFQNFQESNYVENITAYIENNAKNMLENAGATAANAIGMIANTVMVLVLVPFVLFFMLKDGEQAPKFLYKILPRRHKEEAEDILDDMDGALSAYIQGQMIVSFCVGLTTYIGYLIIGLDYSLVLGLIAMVTNVIPFIGPWFGAFPAVIVGLLDSPLQALLVVVVVVIAQQIDSNITSPLVMGKKLNVHPLTIIFVLLVAGKFGGLFGMIFAVPVYALLKVIVSHMYRYWKLE
ncbi:AI-2E family transporter [Siminovitchia sediminis]|uniref:AI-2E family transporter n=1 Tax=Siminovitchia sediminis TaxID=1274353 RepID=A0ABW4KCT6_9BACI